MKPKIRASAPGQTQSNRSNTEVVQSDLTMNLFMVLVIVFSTLAAATAAVTTVGYKVRMNPDLVDGQPPPLGIVQSWRPVQPISPRLVVRSGMVHRLDLDRLAVSLADGSKFLYDFNDTVHIPEDNDPAAYRVDFTLGQDPIPDEIVAWRIPATAFAVAAVPTATSLRPFAADLELFEQFDVFVYEGGEPVAWDVVARLYAANKRYRIFFAPNTAKFGFERSSRLFTFEDIYK